MPLVVNEQAIVTLDSDHDGCVHRAPPSHAHAVARLIAVCPRRLRRPYGRSRRTGHLFGRWQGCDRTFDPTDAWVNALGASLGFALALVVLLLWIRPADPARRAARL